MDDTCHSDASLSPHPSQDLGSLKLGPLPHRAEIAWSLARILTLAAKILRWARLVFFRRPECEHWLFFHRLLLRKVKSIRALLLAVFVLFFGVQSVVTVGGAGVVNFFVPAVTLTHHTLSAFRALTTSEARYQRILQLHKSLPDQPTTK